MARIGRNGNLYIQTARRRTTIIIRGRGYSFADFLRILSVVLVVTVALIGVSFTVNSAAAWYVTPHQAGTWYDSNNVAQQNYGAETQYAYDQNQICYDTLPAFYSAVESHGAGGNWVGYFPLNIKIMVTGTDPMGNTLSGDRFKSLTILGSPEDNAPYIDILGEIYNFLVNQLPYGIGSYIEYGKQTSNYGTGYDSSSAWGYYAYPWYGVPSHDRGIRLGFNLQIDPTVKGTYTVIIHYQVEVWYWYVYSVKKATIDLYDTIQYNYAQKSGGGGGCPYLYVYDGSQYVNEGLLDIHTGYNGTDLIRGHTLSATPATVGYTYMFRLTEHWKTISHINQVLLYATISDGNTIQLPLVSAVQTQVGNVLPQLLFNDDLRAVELGAKWNNGTSQSIDLRFLALPSWMHPVSFTFVIIGYNSIIK
jgi:hypothetical protein